MMSNRKTLIWPYQTVVRTGSSSSATAISESAMSRNGHVACLPSERKHSMITRYSAMKMPAVQTIRATSNDISANGMKMIAEMGAYV